MGLIGNVLSLVIGIPSSTDRALLDTLCLACLADGRVTKLEVGHAREIALEMPGFRRKSREDLQSEIETALADIERVGRPATLERIADTLKADVAASEQAFALAAVIVWIDLDLRDDEKAFLETLRGALAISEERAAAILAEIEREVATIERGDQPAPGT